MARKKRTKAGSACARRFAFVESGSCPFLGKRKPPRVRLSDALMVVLLRQMRLQTTQAAHSQANQEPANKTQSVIPGLTLDT